MGAHRGRGAQPGSTEDLDGQGGKGVTPGTASAEGDARQISAGSGGEASDTGVDQARSEISYSLAPSTFKAGDDDSPHELCDADAATEGQPAADQSDSARHEDGKAEGEAPQDEASEESSRGAKTGESGHKEDFEATDG